MYQDLFAKLVKGIVGCLFFAGCVSVIPAMIFVIHWLSGSQVVMHWERLLDPYALLHIPIVSFGVLLGLYIAYQHMLGRL